MPAILPSQLDPLEQHEIPAEYDPAKIRGFIAWCKDSGGAEISNAHHIFLRLCEALGVSPPDLKKAGGDNQYIFEEDVKHGKAPLRIDVYKRGSFVFEAKQGVNPPVPGAAQRIRAGHSKNVRGAGVRDTTEWTDKMRSGRHQAGNYAVHVAERGDPKPPFILVADVGYRLWVWSSFSRDVRDDYGDFGQLAAFTWDELARPEVFKLLRQIWLNPEELNEEARGQRVTAEIAEKVGILATRLERRFEPTHVGDFLMKCVFTMFAEDVGFLPIGLFTERLKSWLADARSGKPDRFVRGLRSLWMRMRDGGDLDTGHPIRQFNGYLFREPEPLPLDGDDMEDLLEAAKADWRKVSPAIFGTLLERALSEKKRQRLGAHYTPEAYIRRLVEKTIMTPLRKEWRDVRALMERELRTGSDRAKAKQRARDIGHGFRKRLTSTTVLDPACGSGNFLYVALKEMKRLEGEVVRELLAVGDKQTWLDLPGETVHPQQFFGIEIEPWAAKIAELVLWIGYLQWQVSAGRLDRMPPPILQDLHHIWNRDALIDPPDREEVVYGSNSKPIMRARGVTAKKGEREMVPVTRYVGVRRAEWPPVEFIVGNPPFLGNKRLNDILDPGYVEALKGAYPGVPGSADLVMYWWWRCADLLHQPAGAEGAAKAENMTAGSSSSIGAAKRTSKRTKARRADAAAVQLRRFGLVTTNSVTQKFNRAVVTDALENKGVKLAYAIPDHPWFDEGAAVRIAMTVGAREVDGAVQGSVVDESRTKAADLDSVKVEEVAVEKLNSDLTSGIDVSNLTTLSANEKLAYQGMNPVGEGFRISAEELRDLGYAPDDLPAVVKPYLIGRDLVRAPEKRFIIDFFGTRPEDSEQRHPKLWNRLAQLVRPEREKNNRKSRRRNWWLFGEPVEKLRHALRGTTRYIATCRTAKYRVFTMVNSAVIPDTKIVAIALSDFTTLSILSSRPHVVWSLRLGGWLGVGNDPTYNHLDCFGKFPFPSLTPQQSAELSKLGERLDAHRKARQIEHPELTLTDTYNVLTKLRVGEALDENDQQVRNKALVDTLLHIHESIDRLVLSAYGWPTDLSDEAIISQLVALNAERAAEEAKGIIRWLRPEYQAKGGQTQLATSVPQPGGQQPSKPRKKKASRGAQWPADMPGRIQALTTVLRDYRKEHGPGPLSSVSVAALFQGAKLDDVEVTLQCAAAADAVARIETEEGAIAWMARAT